MKTGMKRLERIALSQTTTKVLVCLVVGMNAAVIFRSDATFLKAFVIVMLITISVAIIAASYTEASRTEAEKESPDDAGNVTNGVTNALLAILVLMTLTSAG